MRPEARVQAAIDCLDAILAGAPAEKALTGWARRARYAGSKDRAAVRTHVYDVLRRKRACTAAGGGGQARALMLGLVRLQGGDVDALFSGGGYGPEALNTSERAVLDQPLKAMGPEVPEWLLPRLKVRFGTDLEAELDPLAHRAPVFLRVNRRKTDPVSAVAQLVTDGIIAAPFHLAENALIVTEGARKVAQSAAYRDGLVELQDAASQAAMEAVSLSDDLKILDYCAGGGGKILALAGRATAGAGLFAHDANPVRLRDLPARAERAGVRVSLLQSDGLSEEAPFGVVLCDVPCSGSGTWARDPDAKWRFSEADLKKLNTTQDAILDAAAPLVGQGGVLVYATCSLLGDENEARIAAFQQRNPGWVLAFSRQWAPSEGANGFFSAHLCRA
ncbi:RsmB/NOP family class I SAM-dependent RNA methyltransferase [Aquicoccus sp. G2-2]|uniref:RsmB/NOP family class I SAM-dependent RNA methyltransferase n=1 Tax=Aquicoccus sp. G2-2 TaxID=3092120 RepID=UPI002ADF8C81|nr:RsmB/NOP family class I SAM-dependent RNA methyltransferase [Aquicoccus sp. G2-2]MEA1113390.1 RsmB/NOP family class I SAM-dependent RNA methyltransferase [Aquicoccus sp. G2-2]